MRVVIFGGGGFIGRHLAAALTAKRADIVLMTRHREKIKGDLILLPQTDVVSYDPNYPQTWLPHLGGADAVINLAGILNEKKKGDFEKVHCELTRRLVDGCLNKKIKLFVQMSALGATLGAPSDYLRSRARAEQIVRDASGLRHAIICPSVVCGAGDSFLTRFAMLSRRAPFLPLPCARAKMQPIAVDDLARLIIFAVENNKQGNQKLEAGGPQILTLQQIVEQTIAVGGKPRLVIPLSEKTSYLFAWAAEKFGDLITCDNCLSATVPSVCRNNAAEKVLGVLTPLQSVLQTMFNNGEVYRAH